MGLVVKTQITALVKELNRSKGCGISGISEDFLPALDAKVKKAVEEAIARAHSNSRRTLMGRDL